jgi:hypothetical protein
MVSPAVGLQLSAFLRRRRLTEWRRPPPAGSGSERPRASNRTDVDRRADDAGWQRTVAIGPASDDCTVHARTLTMDLTCSPGSCTPLASRRSFAFLHARNGVLLSLLHPRRRCGLPRRRRSGEHAAVHDVRRLEPEVGLYRHAEWPTVRTRRPRGSQGTTNGQATYCDANNVDKVIYSDCACTPANVLQMTSTPLRQCVFDGEGSGDDYFVWR